MNTQLAQKVISINFRNAQIPLIVEKALDHFRKFEGKQIFKNNGDLKKKCNIRFNGKHVLETELGKVHASIEAYFQENVGQIQMNINCCISGGSWEAKNNSAFTIYEKKSIYLGQSHPTLELIEPDLDGFEQRFDAKQIEADAALIKAEREKYNKSVAKIDYNFRDIVGVRVV
tara:strand:+ start:687 stop:1205 length:519 start_codon:yes stop_codon:yes gene_type:complete